MAAAQSCDDPIIKIWGSAGSEFEIRLFDSDLPDGAKNMTIDLNGHQIEDISFYLTSDATIYITDSAGGGRAETLSAGSANVKLSGGSYWCLKVGSGRSVT